MQGVLAEQDLHLLQFEFGGVLRQETALFEEGEHQLEVGGVQQALGVHGRLAQFAQQGLQTRRTHLAVVLDQTLLEAQQRHPRLLLTVAQLLDCLLEGLVESAVE